jgi:hypothetical protein
MAKGAKPRKKSKPVKKTLSKPPAALSLTGGGGGGSTCKCDEGDDGLFYCYKRVQGRWVACRGPYQTLQVCIDKTGERCG